MKSKKLIVLISLFCLLPLNSCGDSTSSQTGNDQFKVTFEYNYLDCPDPIVVNVKKGEVVEPPSNFSRDRYQFTNWYNDKECTEQADFEYQIIKDTFFYADWKQLEVQVTFDSNYQGGEKFYGTCKVGSSVATPTTPTRNNYIFDGWYTDNQLTEQFDFSSILVSDITVYAKWEEDSGENVILTYMWNYEGAPDNGIYDTVKIVKDSKTISPTPIRNDYYFITWFKEADCLNAFDFNKRIFTSVTLYAKWYVVNNFEAEYTDVSKIHGSGYSGEAEGTNIIEKDVYEAQASNGFYISWLYNKGTTLTFNINSDEELANTYVSLRLSAEYYTKGLDLNDEEFLVTLNQEKVSFSDLVFDLKGVENGKKLPFSNHLISKTSIIKKGDNVITLTVNNSTKYQGTMYAKAPIVDCVYLYSEKTISWGQGYPLKSNIEGK